MGRPAWAGLASVCQRLRSRLPRPQRTGVNHAVSRRSDIGRAGRLHGHAVQRRRFLGAYFANGATAGAAVFVDETTGAPQMQATNSFTGEIGFTGTASLSSVTGNMTLATITSGIITVGDVLSGTGVVSGTTITGLVSGTPNTVGAVYSLSVAPTTESAEAVTTASNVLNITAVADGGLSVGDVISGSGVTTGTSIASFITGTGGIGTYGLRSPAAFRSIPRPKRSPARRIRRLRAGLSDRLLWSAQASRKFRTLPFKVFDSEFD